MPSRTAFSFQTSNANVQELSLKAQSIFDKLTPRLSNEEKILLFDLEELVSSMLIEVQN